MEKLKMSSPDMLSENVEKIAALFPNCVTETAEGKAIDFDLLKQELNNEVIEGNKERYRLEWPGKREAIVTANLPTTKTLRPVREDSLDFDNTENLYIEGDNLEVLKLLQESYLGKIKMIYIDPPYNTGNDFVYKDNFKKEYKASNIESGLIDDEDRKLAPLKDNPETDARYHSDWLSMMYPRLKLARNLLKDDGVIFISIDDNEVTNLKKICDEIFGEDNFIGTFCVRSTPNARDYGHIGKMHEYCLFYAKDHRNTETYHLPDKTKIFKYKDKISGFNIHPLYNSNENFHKNNRPNLYYPFYVYEDESLDENGFYKIGLDKKINSIEVYPSLSVKNNVQFVWRWGREKSLQNLNTEIIGYKTNEGEFRIVQKMRTSEKVIRSILDSKEISTRRGTSEVESLFSNKIFSFPKPISLVSSFLQATTKTNDIILDFFSGSATTAHSIFHLNNEDGQSRKFIMIQLSEKTDEKSEAYNDGYKNLCEIGKERIRRAGNKILEESKTKEGELEFDSKNDNKLDVGFRVYRLDESNMQDVYYKPQEYEQGQLDLVADNVKSDRTADDLLAQVMLDWGLPLSLKIEQVDVFGKKLFKVAENSLFACFDTGIDEEFAKEIAKESPLRIVFKDSAFKDDTAKVNVKQLLKQLSPETEMKVI